MTAWKPTRQQFFDLGLPAESCTAVARTLDAVTLSGSIFTLDGHGFTEGDRLRFTLDGEGAALPAPLSAALVYLAVPTSDSTFSVATLGGSGVMLSDVGSGVISVVLDFGPRLDRILEHFARYVDNHATPYAPPFTAETVPADFVLMACRLAALQVATILRATTPSYSIEDIRQNAALAQSWLDKLKSGTPLAVPPTDRTPGVAEMGARSFKRNPGRGWRTDGL